MNCLKLVIFIPLIIVLTSICQGQEWYAEKHFVIILSTKSYQSALTTAKQASEKLELPLDLRGNYQTSNGLDNDEICQCGEKHGYFPRGRHDDGNYVSIEYSDGYQGFSKGYYMVIISSNEKPDSPIQILNTAKDYYSDAYIKRSKFYMGCMH